MENSKIWIYLSDRELSDEIIAKLKIRIESFLVSWKAHENPLSSFYKIHKSRFIIIGVNEDQFGASGCSIDKQLKFIQEIEKEFGIQLLNRLLVAYETDEIVQVVHQNKIKELLEQNKINENTLIYNNSISRANELETNWIIKLRNSWLNKYL